MHYQQGGKVPNSCFQGDLCIKGRNFGRNAFVHGVLAFMLLGAHFSRNGFVQGELAFMLSGALFCLNFSCALLLMVSSHVASP
jgi:hypothetical protein